MWDQRRLSTMQRSTTDMRRKRMRQTKILVCQMNTDHGITVLTRLFFFTSFEFFRYSSPNWKSTCNSHLFYNVEYILCLPPYLNIFTFRTSQSFHTQHICLPFCAKFVKQSSKNIYGLVRLRRHEDIKIISWWLNYESYLVFSFTLYVFRHKIDRIQLFPLRMKFFRKFVFLESLFNQSNIIQVTRVSQGRFIFKATVALAYE